MKRAILALVSTLAATQSGAQSPDSVRTIGTVVVTASKSPAEKSSLSQSVTTITGDELRARGVARVSDALRSVPGASVVQNGTTGSVNTLFLRGGESRYTKVLIDGVAVNASGGFFDFSHLTTDNIDRIEVVRGPASVVHGADAMSGVIQISLAWGGQGNSRPKARAGHMVRVRPALYERKRRRHALLTRWVGSQNGRVSTSTNQYYNERSAACFVRASRGSRHRNLSRYGAAEFHYPRTTPELRSTRMPIAFSIASR